MTELDRDSSPLLIVVAILRYQGRYFVQKREATGHLDGYWEFPGGKVEPGESPMEALARELNEELGVRFSSEPCLLERVAYQYPTRGVEILFYLYNLKEYQPILPGSGRWLLAEELAEIKMPPANEAVIRYLV